MRLKHLLLAACAMASLSACTQVMQGEVGVRVTEVGSHAGVQDRELTTGRYWPPMGTRIIIFPVTAQTVTWDTNGEAIRFNNKDGAPTIAPVSVTFSVTPNSASKLVQRYKLGMPEIIAGPMRREVQNAFVTNGVNYTSEALYGLGAQQLSAAVARDVNKKLGPQGLVIESINWAGGAILPKNIVAQINAKTAETQAAAKAQARVATVEAEARQAIANAQGKATALDLEGAALRRNPEVLKLREIERSRGLCPMGANVCVVGTSAAAVANAFNY